MLNIRYGNGFVRLNRPSADTPLLQCEPVKPITDYKAAFSSAAVRCVASLPLHMLLRPFDCVTLLVPRVAVLSRDRLLSAIIDYLIQMGIAQSNIAILVVDSGSELVTAPAPAALPPFLDNVRVQWHDPDAQPLVALGTTARGTPVLVNPLLAGRNRVICIDAVRPDPLLGFTGGPECLLGACGRATLEGCLRSALSPDGPMLQTYDNAAPQGVFCDELQQVARIVQPLFCINLSVDGLGQPFEIICGKWQESWHHACVSSLNAAGAQPLARADIVIASAGGTPHDLSLPGAVRGLLTAAGAAKPGGIVIFAAECRETGIGQFADCLEAWSNSSLETLMQEHPRFAQFYFAALLQVAGTHTILMQSKINTQTLAILGLRGFRTSETMEVAVDWTGKSVCCLPQSLRTVPQILE